MLPNRNLLSFPFIFVYGLSFMILWEWLRPLPIITDTGNLNVFIWFTLYCFIIIYFRLKSYISIPLIIIGLLYGIHFIFFEGSFVKEGLSTFFWLVSDIQKNISFIIQNNLALLSYEFRSLLLFLVLAVTSYLIHYWIVQTKKIFFFLFFTIVYITVIDTFTSYDASHAIVRLVIAGFILITFLFKMKLEEKEEVEYDDFRGKGWTNTLIVIIGITATIAFFLPKYEPYWPDPLPMIKSTVTGGTGEGVSKTIGYGQNDERLGGGFQQDDTIVFTAIAKKGQYWRGESKEVYTGKGWESVPHQVNKTFRYSDSYDDKIAVQLYGRNVVKTKHETTIKMVGPTRFWHFFYPGELVDVNEETLILANNSLETDYQYLIDYVSGKIGTTKKSGGDPVFLQEYTLTYSSPKFVIDHLKKAPDNDPDHIREVYLQLPEIPDRVSILAEEVTSEFSNRYEKVKAVERYFAKSGFIYETKDVTTPGPDQDYVDQFLFETQQGYCDNFSTAMVVMLRSLDIPARWVKGFTQGEVAERLEDGYRLYEISNANAHSWVEVYFPENGWVPFEPTRGFNHTFDFVEEQLEPGEIENRDQNDNNQSQPERQQDPENPFLPLEEQQDDRVGSRTPVAKGEELKKFEFPFKLFYIILAIAFFAYIIHKNYQKIMTVTFLSMYSFLPSNKKMFLRSYQRLLWLLGINGYKRQENETLREFAIRLDRQLSTDEMSNLTLLYEKLYYGNGNEEEQWSEYKRQWIVLIKKMML